MSGNQPITVRCHGPYGAPAFALPVDEQCVLLYVGGIGCTPALSMLATWAAAAASGSRVPHAMLVWAVRDVQLLRSFSSLLDGIARDTEHFTLELYCMYSAETVRPSVSQTRVRAHTDKPLYFATHLTVIC